MIPMPRALITGITGQDGSYLAELLIAKGYEVHGVVRRTSTLERSRLKHLYNNPEIYGQRLFLHYADLEDPTTLRRVLVRTAPNELYHLAGQSHVGLSFDMVESTCEMTAQGHLASVGDDSRFRASAAVVSRIIERNLRSLGWFSPEREDPFPTGHALWLRQSVCHSDGGHLSADLQPVCVQWHPVQP